METMQATLTAAVQLMTDWRGSSPKPNYNLVFNCSWPSPASWAGGSWLPAVHIPQGTKEKNFSGYAGFSSLAQFGNKSLLIFIAVNVTHFFSLYVRQPLISCMSKSTPSLLNDLNSSRVRLCILWEASRFFSFIYSYPLHGKACCCNPLHCPTLLLSVTVTFISEGDMKSPRLLDTLLCLTLGAMLQEGAPSLHLPPSGCRTAKAPCFPPQVALGFPGKAMWS